MTTSRSWRLGVCMMVMAVWITAMAPARSDGPSSDSSLNPDEALKVVFAVYGGIENAQAHYVDVTDKVAGLLQKSASGFPVTEEAVLDKAGTKEFQSLIIIYNYQERSYFYNIPEGQGTISLDKLKKAARIHPSHAAAIPDPGTPDSDFRVVFATYGVSDVFWNVSDLVKKLIRDNPEGFLAHEDVMGGDPHWGNQKALVVVFDDSVGRHFYAQVNNGPLLNKAVLLDSAKSN